MKKINVIVASLAVFLVGFGGVMLLMRANRSEVTPSQTSSNVDVVESPDQTDAAAIATNEKTQEEMLVYLIEEEKLAHDVYTVMYQQYGSKVFGNILKSEENHQSRVFVLLKSRDIADPRSSELGVFNNTDLQKLYDSLVQQGKQSVSEAYKVGVAIEEKDIADITKQLATAVDEDIISALNSLRDGSENHLRAFNRQLGKF